MNPGVVDAQVGIKVRLMDRDATTACAVRLKTYLGCLSNPCTANVKAPKATTVTVHSILASVEFWLFLHWWKRLAVSVDFFSLLHVLSCHRPYS